MNMTLVDGREALRVQLIDPIQLQYPLGASIYVDGSYCDRTGVSAGAWRVFAQDRSAGVDSLHRAAGNLLPSTIVTDSVKAELYALILAANDLILKTLPAPVEKARLKGRWGCFNLMINMDCQSVIDYVYALLTDPDHVQWPGFEDLKPLLTDQRIASVNLFKVKARTKGSIIEEMRLNSCDCHCKEILRNHRNETLASGEPTPLQQRNKK